MKYVKTFETSNFREDGAFLVLSIKDVKEKIVNLVYIQVLNF